MQVSAMGVWYNETYKILSTEMDYTLTDLDAYLRSADGKDEFQRCFALSFSVFCCSTYWQI